MTAARGSATRPASSPSELDRSADIANLGRVFDLNVMRERILAAAITNVADHGFGAFTVREVAAVAGIKAPGLYSHFPSKEAILTEAVSRVLADFLENSTHVDGVDPEADLRETVRQHVLYQMHNMHIARVADLVLYTASAGQFLSTDDYDRLLALQSAHLNLVRDRVTAFAPDVSETKVTVASMAIIAMCDRVANWFPADGARDPEELADLHWQLIRAMLVGLGPDRS
ncbi:TetR/AcrR family transcriptional regulator [Mycolicibacterium sp. lyk4-40-TYG-92]|uniref:TetR/AcrR family transcriptional regulator n=1 Tax=Mycolicibacterium sp. lyk4-40-TYG-92 TaxID=3040295 RepID=UPI00254CE6B9|nr:TetR/AcrR family transcriptional regulator [Mycolicibacterium sp. lyk4-40-TYG-92]